MTKNGCRKFCDNHPLWSSQSRPCQVERQTSRSRGNAFLPDGVGSIYLTPYSLRIFSVVALTISIVTTLGDSSTLYCFAG